MLSTHVPSKRVFISHASEDNSLVERIASTLHSNGISIFLDQEYINPGDSIRQKIDEALESCSHFVPVLTPASKNKPWVNIEIEGAILRMVKQTTRVIPLICGLRDGEIPPTLAGTKWVRIDDSMAGVDNLINYIQPPVSPLYSPENNIY